MISATSRKIVRNTAFNTIGRIWLLASSFLVTPFIIGHLGVERYGVWAIASVITSYLEFLDLGVSSGFARYVADYDAQDDKQRVNEILATGLAFYTILAIAFCIVGFLVSDLVTDFFSMKADMRDEALFVARIAFVIFGLEKIKAVFTGLINGLQRMDLVNGISITVSIPRILAIIVLLRLGYGLRQLIVIELAQLILAGILTIVIARRCYSSLAIGPTNIRAWAVRKLIFYGMNLQASSLSALMNFQLDKVLIGRVMGVSWLTYYYLGSRMSYILRSFPELLITAMMPAVSELHSRGERETIYNLFLNASKVVTMIVLPVMVFFIVTADSLAYVWLGPGFERGATIARILLWGYSANIMFGVISPVVQGMERPQIQMRAALLSAALNLALSLLLFWRVGFYGAALGTTIAMTIAGLYYVVAFHSYVRQSLINYVRVFFMPCVSCIVAASSIVGVRVGLHTFMGNPTRLIHFGSMAITALIFGGVYLFAVMRFMDEGEKELLVRILSQGKASILLIRKAVQSRLSFVGVERG
jgi:O-antigen/teichoic acid export membrane protein